MYVVKPQNNSGQFVINLFSPTESKYTNSPARAPKSNWRSVRLYGARGITSLPEYYRIHPRSVLCRRRRPADIAAGRHTIYQWQHKYTHKHAWTCTCARTQCIALTTCIDDLTHGKATYKRSLFLWKVTVNIIHLKYTLTYLLLCHKIHN